MDLSFVIVTILIILIAVLLYFVLSMKKDLQQQALILSTKDNIEDKFRYISNDILMSNQKNFINLAKETFDKTIISAKSDLDKKQDIFISIIDPIKQSLNLFNSKIETLEKERLSSYSDLRGQIENLMKFQHNLEKTTSDLSKALSSPTSSGKWGEMQLRRTVELAGMIPYCDFIEQHVVDNSLSRVRPDMIIRLPGNRNIIVDAKTSLNDYMKYVNSGDKIYLNEHVKRIKEHIRILGGKAYWEQFSKNNDFITPDFVLMFLPGESFFSAAIKQDPTLVDFSISEKVIITTPITLIAVLKAIAFTWRQEAISTNAKHIGEIGMSLQSKLEKLFEGTEVFSNRLSKTLEEYDKIRAYIRKEILPSANILKNLGTDVTQKATDTEMNKSLIN